MIPLSDVTSRSRGLPVTTTLLILANALVYMLMAAGGDERFEEWTYGYATIPSNVTAERTVTWESVILGVPEHPERAIEVTFLPPELPPRLPPQRAERYRNEKLWSAARNLRLAWPAAEIKILAVNVETQAVPAWLTLLTSMFMHGGLAHLGGNMIFLWVFGGRLEQRLGRLRYLAFYLATGVLAGLAHVVLNAAETIPTVGASGAISGLLGGYVLLFPHGRILTLVILFFIHLVELPAVIFVGIWVALQVLYISQETNIAVWAHLGGFVFGLLLIRLLAPRREPARRSAFRPWQREWDPFEHFR